MDDCEHLDFHAHVEVHRIEDQLGLLHIELTVSCSSCEQLAVFHNLPVGLSSYRPTASLDGKELRIAAMMDGHAVPEGLAGFGVSVGVGNA